ncbi:NUDIX domain-containing protein [Ferdinandcohnia sp. Marseille-Q9671]
MNRSKNNGFEFLDLLTIREEEIHYYEPVAGSFAIITCSGKYLLCFNTWRQQWEIPAGKREENETPRECAIIELYEETGQEVGHMEFLGLLKVKNISNNALKYNPIYFASIESLQPFQKNHETSDIKLWDVKETIGTIDEVDFTLLTTISKKPGLYW